MADRGRWHPFAATGARTGAKAASGVVGLVLAIIAIAFVARTLLRDREEIADALEQARPGWLIAGFLVAAVGMVAIALPWRRALRLLGGDLPIGQLVARYFVGEIGKYVPGGVWPILGRGELARRHGVRRVAAYGSVALSLVALYLAAMFVVVATLPALLSGDDGTGPVAVVLLLPVGLVALHPRVLTAALGFVERVTRRHVDLELPSWRQSVTLVSLYVPAWIAIGGRHLRRRASPRPRGRPVAGGCRRGAVVGGRLRARPGARGRRSPGGGVRGGGWIARPGHRRGHRGGGPGAVRRGRRRWAPPSAPWRCAGGEADQPEWTDDSE